MQCSSCSQQFMQKKDLQSHMIKLHGAPKPHAVSARPCQGWRPGPLRCWEPAQGGSVAGLERADCAVSQGRDSRAAPHSGPACLCPLVSHLCQVLPVPDGAAAARGVQAPWGEAVCVRGVRAPGIEPEWLADAHQGQAQVGPSSLDCPSQARPCCYSQGPECPNLCPKPAAFLEGRT